TLEIVHPREHPEDVFQRAELPHHFKLSEEIVEIERSTPEFLLHPRSLFFVDCFGGFFDQANDVAHAENASGETIGHEGLELIEFFSDPGELDWSLSDFAH